MNLGTFATFLATLIFGILTTYFIVTSNLDKAITDKINDPNVIRKIAEHIRVPFLIFDENETYVVDGGAANFIKNINVIKEKRTITKIILILTKKLPVAPILISLNNDVQFFQPTPVKESEWEYRTLQISHGWADSYKEKPPPKLFKFEILDLKYLEK
ncbi:MAG: hypothetical protein JRF71_14760 [Deltaproteobacteria bacterium]|nr:hypothetical protein [Deltaproteobacteria bacterium]